MARYNMTKEINELAKLKGVSTKEIARALKIKFLETKIVKEDDKWSQVEIPEDKLEFEVWNKREENRVLLALEKAKIEQETIKFRAAKKGNPLAYVEPFFTRSGDGWAVVARGIDFVTDGYGASVVKVRRRDGKVSTIEVINNVDTGSTEIKIWDIK